MGDASRDPSEALVGNRFVACRLPPAGAVCPKESPRSRRRTVLRCDGRLAGREAGGFPTGTGFENRRTLTYYPRSDESRHYGTIVRWLGEGEA